jgi:P-type Cu2+ transporter
METAATRLPRHACAHCGLPVTVLPVPARPGDIYCCHACRLVAAIVGKQARSEHAWNLLRLGLGTLLAMNIMMISLLLYTGGIEPHIIPAFRHLLLYLAAPALVILVPPFLAGAVREAGSKKLSLDTLIAGGSISAFAVSTVNVLRGSGNIYFDTATMLPVLVTVGKLIEAGAKTRAAELLKSLETLLPKTALRVTPSGSHEVALDLLSPGDRVRVRPGERVAVDGRILEGTSSIEEAAFTGEFLPRLCRKGDAVIAGTVNGTGTLLVQAERTGRALLLHGILDLIQDAWRNPSRADRMAQRAAALFIPVVLAVAAGSFLCWSLAGDTSHGLLSAISVLVVACPCTMGIATPLATSLAIARAAKAGIIVRGGSVMERLAGTEMIFFDKTGTLTTGKPVVEEVLPVDPAVGVEELLGVVAALEAASEHPLGKAVIRKSREGGIEQGSAAGVETFPGLGITGAVTWKGKIREVAAGTEAFVAALEGGSEGTSDDTRTLISVAWDGEVQGRLLVTDQVRVDAPAAIKSLGSQGIVALLLSGDTFPAAAAVARQVGISEVYASRSPAQKLEAVLAAVAAGKTVAMAGDGINDAPALAAAQTGIALGGGMDLAKQAGNVIILSERLTQIPWLMALSRRTGKIIRGNFAWSFAYNSIALAAAATGLLHPLLAALLMVISSVTVLANSLRIAAFPDQLPADACQLSRCTRPSSQAD